MKKEILLKVCSTKKITHVRTRRIVRTHNTHVRTYVRAQSTHRHFPVEPSIQSPNLTSFKTECENWKVCSTPTLEKLNRNFKSKVDIIATGLELFYWKVYQLRLAKQKRKILKLPLVSCQLQTFTSSFQRFESAEAENLKAAHACFLDCLNWLNSNLQKKSFNYFLVTLAGLSIVNLPWFIGKKF